MALSCTTAMLRDETVPFPEHWTKVFVSWNRMLDKNPPVHAMLDWVDQHPSPTRFQLRGPERDPTAGFLFYFEDAHDAEVFVLRWL